MTVIRNIGYNFAVFDMYTPRTVSFSFANPSYYFWVCERKRDCRGRIHVKDGEVIANITDHSHGPDLSRVNALKTVKAIRDRAASTQESTQQILGRMKESISEGTAAALPSQPSLKRMIQRQRNRNDRPPLPVNLYELEIPDDFQKLADKSQFLQFDSGPGPDRFLTFASGDALQLLSNSKD